MIKLIILIMSMGGGGTERVASELSLNLCSSIQRRIVTMTNEISYSSNMPPISMNINLNNGVISIFYATVVGIIKYRKIIKSYKPDVSMSFFTLNNFINILSNIGNKKIKVIVSVHNVLSMKFHNSFKDKLTKFLIKILYNKANIVIAVSRGVREELIRDFQIEPEKIRLLYNPVDIKKIQCLANEKVNDEWFNDDVPILINMGRIAEQKGQWYLIRVFSKVREKKECRLVIRGNGELKPYLEKLVRDLDLINDVKFLGWQDNPFKYISKASIFVFPSLWESWGLAIIEAMVCGCPVIATDCKYGPSEILGDGKFGILTPPLDGIFYKASDPLTPEEHFLADEIIKLLENDNLRREYSKKGKERAKDFDIDLTIRKYENIIRE